MTWTSFVWYQWLNLSCYRNIVQNYRYDRRTFGGEHSQYIQAISNLLRSFHLQTATQLLKEIRFNHSIPLEKGTESVSEPMYPSSQIEWEKLRKKLERNEWEWKMESSLAKPNESILLKKQTFRGVGYSSITNNCTYSPLTTANHCLLYGGCNI